MHKQTLIVLRLFFCNSGDSFQKLHWCFYQEYNLVVISSLISLLRLKPAICRRRFNCLKREFSEIFRKFSCKSFEMQEKIHCQLISKGIRSKIYIRLFKLGVQVCGVFIGKTKVTDVFIVKLGILSQRECRSRLMTKQLKKNVFFFR